MHNHRFCERAHTSFPIVVFYRCSRMPKNVRVKEKIPEKIATWRKRTISSSVRSFVCPSVCPLSQRVSEQRKWITINNERKANGEQHIKSPVKIFVNWKAWPPSISLLVVARAAFNHIFAVWHTLAHTHRQSHTSSHQTRVCRAKWFMIAHTQVLQLRLSRALALFKYPGNYW